MGKKTNFLPLITPEILTLKSESLHDLEDIFHKFNLTPGQQSLASQIQI